MAPLALAACVVVERDHDSVQMGSMRKMGKQYGLSFRTWSYLAGRFVPAGATVSTARVECELDGPTALPGDVAVPRRLFRAPIKLVRSGNATPDGRYYFFARGDFLEVGAGAADRKLPDRDIEAAIAGRTAIPCRFLAPSAGGGEAVIASADLLSVNVHAAIHDLPPYGLGSNDTGRGLSR